MLESREAWNADRTEYSTSKKLRWHVPELRRAGIRDKTEQVDGPGNDGFEAGSRLPST